MEMIISNTGPNIKWTGKKTLSKLRLKCGDTIKNNFSINGQAISIRGGLWCIRGVRQ